MVAVVVMVTFVNLFVVVDNVVGVVVVGVGVGVEMSELTYFVKV